MHASTHKLYSIWIDCNLFHAYIQNISNILHLFATTTYLDGDHSIAYRHLFSIPPLLFVNTEEEEGSVHAIATAIHAERVAIPIGKCVSIIIIWLDKVGYIYNVPWHSETSSTCITFVSWCKTNACLNVISHLSQYLIRALGIWLRVLVRD